jgi:demethoxyubiquinone hydroxylase (CLK1/Coq7/Cat5 family)
MLELALWKMRLNEESHNEKATWRQKKIKTDESIVRSQCRATCGADIVIALVPPFNGIWGISVS